LNEFSKHRHTDDAILVDRLVSELQQESPSPVIAYKPQGVSSKEYQLPDDSFFDDNDIISSTTLQNFLER